MAEVKHRELISQAAYARRRGVSEAAVSKAIRRCGIPLIEGKIDPLVADTLWRERTDPDQQRRAMAQNLKRPEAPEPPDPEPTHDWRKRRDRAEALRAEYELAELEGALVRKDDVEKAARRLASAIVLQLSSIPDRMAAEFGADDALRRKIRHRLQEALDVVRAEFARAGMMADQ